MLLRSTDTEKNSNNFLSALSLGKYGIKKTYLHLAFALLFAIAVDFFSKSANWNTLAIAIAIFIYGIYITNVGLGLWRASRTVRQEIASFLNKAVAVISILFGISAIFNSLKLLLTYL
ncbi:hypothetical protein [Serratia quinivorans]|uniref:hypothetical protein n=1 Tax=Serratia quinivorans TaxID=137545 RepID=UPI0021BD8CBE|nr:hypothetical protein [Serratia quinivorans]